VFRQTHQSSRSRHKIGQGKVYYRDTEYITKLYHGSRRLLKEDASRRSTSIECEFEDPVLEALVDRYQIQQIIINLVNKTTPIACWEGGINWRAAAAGACFTIWRQCMRGQTELLFLTNRNM
jgi:hypothetical protein